MSIAICYEHTHLNFDWLQHGRFWNSGFEMHEMRCTGAYNYFLCALQF